MRVLMSGASGLVGSALRAFLLAQRHDVVSLVRRSPRGPGEVRWDPLGDELRLEEPFDGVIHLGGENVAGSVRWTRGHKRRVLESRERGTRTLVNALLETRAPPRVLVSASATGFYGDRGDEWLDESSPSGEGFLAEVCRRWEGEASRAETGGIRVVRVRLGIVLSGDGGALATMRVPFSLGLGGRLGSGRQWMSWVGASDVTAIFARALVDETISGPLNAVAPEPVRNVGFTETLGRALGSPTPFPVPAVVLRLTLGEMADEMLLASSRVRPSCLLDSGFVFEEPDLDSALRAALH